MPPPAGAREADLATRLTEADGRRALRDHAVERALAARATHGPVMDAEAFARVLADRSVVRYPTTVRFDAGPLRDGEFAYAAPLGDGPSDGFCICVHPAFADRPEDWPLLAAYHLVSVNYGAMATAGEAEAFGAALFGLEVDAYYERVCALADSL